MRNRFVRKLNSSKSNSVEVMSAFNGFAIYRTERFKGIQYDGVYKNYRKLVTDADVENTIHVLRHNHNLMVAPASQAEHECCEHLFYHLTALKMGRKIKVSKFMIN